ncbi:MAG TPA: hypothetical protein VD994_14440 [Prosthecobacter sp.]|nr:hypothetical protein [Prosthecobacter sp.]
MTVEALAVRVIEACEAEGVDHMLTGAFATSLYGIPRSTKDVDVVLSMSGVNPAGRVARRLAAEVEFDSQIQFDTLTWSRRLVGTARQPPPLKVGLFELFDDEFVQEQFRRRRQIRSEPLMRTAWLPTPEDVIIQKLRWGRSKDLDDARDVLAVQGPESLDMSYIMKWCAAHGTTEHLQKALSEIPPLG